MAGNNKGALASALSYINPLETLSGLKDEMKRQVIDEGIKKVPSDIKKEFIGASENAGTPKRGDLAPGEVLDLGKKKDKVEAKPAPHIEAGINYRQEVLHGTEMRRSREQQELDQKLQEIMNELKRLVKSSTVLSNEYATLAVDSGPVKGGSYHVSFFDFMLSVIRTARQKVEDSGAWMAVSKKKNGYQQKAQSLGTKFTLSQERSTATQTG